MSDEYVVLYVRIPAELHDALKARAVQDDRALAATVRVALRHYLQMTVPVASQGLNPQPVVKRSDSVAEAVEHRRREDPEFVERIRRNAELIRKLADS